VSSPAPLPPNQEKVEEKPAEEKLATRYQVTLARWFGWEESLADAIRSAADSDQSKGERPGIRVEPLPGAGDEKLLASIAAGEPSDGPAVSPTQKSSPEVRPPRLPNGSRPVR